MAAQGARAPFLRRGNAVGVHFVDDGLPGARRHVRIVRGEIGATKGQIEDRLALRFIHGIEQALRFALVLGMKASLLGTAVFLPVERAVIAAVESIFELDDFLYVVEIARAVLLLLVSSRGAGGRVRTNSGGANGSAGKSAGNRVKKQVAVWT